MANLKLIGFGSVLIVDGTTVASVISISGPNGSGDGVQTTTLDTTGNFHTFRRGVVDPGEVTFELAYASTNTSHKKLGTLYKSGTAVTCSINDPSTASSAQSFSAFVTSLGRQIALSDMITQSVTMKVSGLPGYTST